MRRSRLPFPPRGLVGLLVCAVLLSACSPAFRTVLIPKGTDATADITACSPKEKMEYPTGDLVIAAVIAGRQRGTFVSCMERRGYRTVTFHDAERGAQWTVEEP